MSIKRFARSLPLALVVLALSACNSGRMPATLPPIPTTEAPPTNTPYPTRRSPTSTPTPGPDVDFDGVAFHIDPSLGVAPGVTLPADGEEAGQPEWMLPSRAVFTIANYPVQKSTRDPVIVAFPIDALKGYNDAGLEVIESISTMLEGQPGTDEFEGPVPQLVVLDENEMFHAQVKYLDFKNGSGMRYVAIYTSDLRPITNEDLIYVFQGITSDGSTYVYMLLPLNQADLAANENRVPDSDMQLLFTDYLGYIGGVANDLDVAADESFKPGLNALDDLVSSLSINLQLEEVTPEPSE